MAFSILDRMEQARGLLSVHDVAEILGFSEKKIYGMVRRKNSFPAVRGFNQV